MKRFTLVLTCMAFALTGCGGDDDENGGGEGDGDVVSAPEAQSSLQEHVDAVNRAIAEGDCEALMETTFSFIRVGEGGVPAGPGDPASPEECGAKAPAPALLAELKGTAYSESEEEGPAAISQGTGGKPVDGFDHSVMISLVDRDGNWRHLAFFPGDPQLDQDPPDDADHAETLDLALEAVRSGDCKDAGSAFNANSPLAGGKGPEAVCRRLSGGDVFGPALKATDAEDAQPEELVAGLDFAIYGIPTEEAYFAVLMATAPGQAGQAPQSHFSLTDVVPLTEIEIEPPPEATATGAS